MTHIVKICRKRVKCNKNTKGKKHMKKWEILRGGVESESQLS